MKNWEIVLVNAFGEQIRLHTQLLTFAEAATYAYLERNKRADQVRILSVAEAEK